MLLLLLLPLLFLFSCAKQPNKMLCPSISLSVRPLGRRSVRPYVGYAVLNQSPKGIKWSAVCWPCSTFLGFHGESRAAALIGDKVLWNGEIFHHSVHLSVHSPPPWAIQSGLRPSQPGLKPSQPGLKPEAWLAIRASDLGGTDVRTYRWKIYSFYRTLSPVRAAA